MLYYCYHDLYGGGTVSTRLPLPPPGFDDLPVDEKLEYVQSLWDRIAADVGQVPVPEWHKEVLRERLREGEAYLDDTRDWDHVHSELRRELRKKESEDSAHREIGGSK